MARTTDDMVRAVMDLDTAIDTEPFIDYANELVTEFCAPVTTYSEGRLAKIETLLAAHFCTLSDPRSTQEMAGTVQASYETKIGFGFRLSRYGQMAMRLDTNGALAAFDNRLNAAEIALPAEVTARPTAGVVWLGTAEE